MKRVLARAPGKAVLLGEYAVVHGTPALAMAVDRYAHITLESCAADQCRVSAPQLQIEPVGFELAEGGRLQWDVNSPGWPALKQTASLLSYLHGLVCERFSDPGPFRVEIDTTELFIQDRGRPVKLGLGSSSAVAVALDAGLRSFAGGQQQSGLSMRALDRLLRPYRRGQDGRGSGIDLATSLCGGVIRYQRQGEGCEVHRVVLPEAIGLLFVWTGQAASTSSLLSIYQRWRDDHPDQSGAILAQMQQACETAWQAIDRGDGEALVEQFGVYGRIMGTMGSLMGAPVLGAEHARIQAEAERRGLAYKPCGAGVGDIGMIAATDPVALSDMRSWLQGQDLRVLSLAVDDQGVQAASELE
jgi:phosphomevalonate kinase